MTNELPTLRTDAIYEPPAVANLRAKSAAIAVEGSVVIVWPENRALIDHIDALKENARTLEREIAAVTKERNQLRLDVSEIRRQHQAEANEWKTDDQLGEELSRWRKMADELAHALVRHHGTPRENDKCETCKALLRYNQLKEESK